MKDPVSITFSLKKNTHTQFFIQALCKHQHLDVSRLLHCLVISEWRTACKWDWSNYYTALHPFLMQNIKFYGRLIAEDETSKLACTESNAGVLLYTDRWHLFWPSSHVIPKGTFERAKSKKCCREAAPLHSLAINCCSHTGYMSVENAMAPTERLCICVKWSLIAFTLRNPFRRHAATSIQFYGPS